MRLVYPNDEQNVRLRDWLADRLGGAPEGNYRTIGLMQDGTLIGGVIFHGYRHPSIEIGFFCADPRWTLNRRKILEVLSYPFLQLKCQRITALVSDSNPRLQTLMELIGFDREGTIRYGAPDGSDIGLFGLLKRDLKWASLRHAQNTSGMMKRTATS